MAPMTTCTGYFDGTVTSELVEYYRGVPAASAPLLLSAALLTTGSRLPGRHRIDNDEKLPGWRKSPRPLNPKDQKRFCRSTTAAAWSTRN
jgi:2,4-dienoyl-CoA reductase-like NADH-dependent reductase (Old Yellow Enzyme family)